MPNWCSNEIVISGAKEEVNKVVELVEKAKQNEDRLLNLIIPMPEELRKTTSNGFNDYNEKGEPITWYSWSLKNWGTKWDVDDLQYKRESEDKLIISFKTAWNPPVFAILKLSKLFSKVMVLHRFYELGNDFVGSANMLAGELLEHGCHNAVPLTMACHGFDPDILNTFDFMEDVPEDSTAFDLGDGNIIYLTVVDLKKKEDK